MISYLEKIVASVVIGFILLAIGFAVGGLFAYTPAPTYTPTPTKTPVPITTHMPTPNVQDLRILPELDSIEDAFEYLCGCEAEIGDLLLQPSDPLFAVFETQDGRLFVVEFRVVGGYWVIWETYQVGDQEPPIIPTATPMPTRGKQA